LRVGNLSRAECLTFRQTAQGQGDSSLDAVISDTRPYGIFEP
jgi:hypothetical protein